MRDAGEPDSDAGAQGDEESADHQQQRGRGRRGKWIAAGSGADRASHWDLCGTYVGENKLLEEMVLKGTIKLDLVPQGTFSERIRAGGAGIPAFYTPTGVGTMVADGKETREFDGRSYVMERGLKADFAFVKAWKGDREGNLIYRKTARNFNPMMATAAKITIAAVEHLVEVGELDGDAIHTPSIYVKRIFQGELYERRIERRTVRYAGGGQ